MDLFIESLAVHRLSKQIKGFLREVEHPIPSNNNDLEQRFLRMYKNNEITKSDYIFLHTRILLNQFCKQTEAYIGKGAMTGFLFYCEDKHSLFFGAGGNYPRELKVYLQDQPPTVDIKGFETYQNEIFFLNDIDQWSLKDDSHDFRSMFQALNIGTLISKRLRLEDFTFGTFECYFPEKHSATDEDMQYILDAVQPVKEELFHLRLEMIQSLQEMKEAYTM